MKELTPLESKIWGICLKSLADYGFIPSNAEIAHKAGLRFKQQINELLRGIEVKKGGKFKRSWIPDKSYPQK